MASSHNGRRDLRRATQALAALTVAGTVGGSMLAFADTQAKAAASTPTVTPSPGSDSSGGPGAPSVGEGTSSSSGGGGFTAVPPLSSGSGSPVVTSSGS